MKTIYQNAEHIAASTQLAQLQQAHNAATLEESQLLAQLADTPEAKPTALGRAMALITGDQPAPRQDRDGLNSRLTACRENTALLGLAITEQRAIMAGLVSAQSAVINGERKAAHIGAVQGIKTALAGLRDALEAEHALRAEIEAGGYQCSLQPLARPELNYTDTESLAHRYSREIDSYLDTHELSAAKSVNVRLLFATGEDLPGDVVTLTGAEAAARVRLGHAEQTTAKPARVARPVLHSYGVALG